MRLRTLVGRLEQLLFAHRAATLGALVALTVVMGFFASELRMSAGFDKQLPQAHPYVQTFNQYRDQVFGANRIMVVVRAKHGDAWTAPFLQKLNEATQAVMFLPGIDRRTVSSLWTPTTRVLKITEEGFEAEDVIGGNITPDQLTPEKIAKIRNNAILGGYIGQLVANDNSSAMVVADLLDTDPATKKKLDYLDLSRRLEQDVRGKLETPDFDIQIIGFAKQIGDIASGATSVVHFFLLAFLLTAAAVYVYSRSVALTALPLLCSLASVVWQFGTLRLLGFGLDPLAILVPFLVFAIGVSHGVQQINYISKEICSGVDTPTAARRSFTGLLIPGTMALVTAFVGFATLILIPIPMIRELGITASIGVAYKIVTNLVMLPVAASYLTFDDAYVARMNMVRERRTRFMGVLARVAETRYAAVITVAGLALLAVAYIESQGRQIGYLQPGAPELRADSRYNRDAADISAKFDVGLDVLSVVVETPKDGCYDYPTMEYVNQLSWFMSNVPGVVSVASAPFLAKQAFSGFNEGNPKWAALPRDPKSLANAVGLAPEGSALYNTGCTMLPVHVYLTDHKARTIATAVGRGQGVPPTIPTTRCACASRAATSACWRRPTRCCRRPSCR